MLALAIFAATCLVLANLVSSAAAVLVFKPIVARLADPAGVWLTWLR